MLNLCLYPSSLSGLGNLITSYGHTFICSVSYSDVFLGMFWVLHFLLHWRVGMIWRRLVLQHLILLYQSSEILMSTFFQLLECPSIYELMACLEFKWEHVPLLEIWRQKCDSDGNATTMLESYPPAEAIPIFKEALSINKVSYDCYCGHRIWLRMEIYSQYLSADF